MPPSSVSSMARDKSVDFPQGFCLRLFERKYVFKELEPRNPKLGARVAIISFLTESIRLRLLEHGPDACI